MVIFSHLFYPWWYGMSGLPAGHQALSDSIIYSFIHLSASSFTVYPCTFSLASLSFSVPLSSTQPLFWYLPPYLSCVHDQTIEDVPSSCLLNRFYFGLFLYTIICYMFFPFYIVNVPEHPYLSCNYFFLLLLSQ